MVLKGEKRLCSTTEARPRVGHNSAISMSDRFCVMLQRQPRFDQGRPDEGPWDEGDDYWKYSVFVCTVRYGVHVRILHAAYLHASHSEECGGYPLSTREPRAWANRKLFLESHILFLAEIRQQKIGRVASGTGVQDRAAWHGCIPFSIVSSHLSRVFPCYFPCRDER
jgi:hypothetical protein